METNNTIPTLSSTADKTPEKKAAEFSYASLASLSKKKQEINATAMSTNKTTVSPAADTTTTIDPGSETKVPEIAVETVDIPHASPLPTATSNESSDAKETIHSTAPPFDSSQPSSLKEEEDEEPKAVESPPMPSGTDQKAESKVDLGTTSSFGVPPRASFEEIATFPPKSSVDTTFAASRNTPFTPPPSSPRVKYDQGRVLDVSSISTPEEAAALEDEEEKEEDVVSPPSGRDVNPPFKPISKESKSPSSSSKPVSVTELWEIIGSGTKSSPETKDSSTRGFNGSNPRRDTEKLDDVIGIDAELVMPVGPPPNGVGRAPTTSSGAYDDAVLDAFDDDEREFEDDGDWEDDIEEFDPPAREERAVIFDTTQDDGDEDYDDDYYGEPEDYYDDEEEEDYEFAFAPRSEDDDYYEEEEYIEEEVEGFWEEDEFDEYEEEEDVQDGYWEDPPLIDQYGEEDEYGEHEDDYVEGEEVGPFVISDPPQAPENFGSAVAAAAMAKTGGPIPDTAFMPPEVQRQLSQNPVMNVISSPSVTRQSPLNVNDVPSLARRNQMQGSMVTGNMMTPRIRKPSDSSPSAVGTGTTPSQVVPPPAPSPSRKQNFEVSGAVPPTFGSAVADAAAGLGGGITGKPKESTQGLDLVDDVAMKFYKRTWKQPPPE
jgi:hypothetical protein